MIKFLNILVAVSVLWILAVPAAFAHEPTAGPLVGRGSGCTNYPNHIQSGNLCVHPTTEQAAGIAESIRSVSGPATEPPGTAGSGGRGISGCRVGYELDASQNLCVKIVCPTGLFFDTNNRTCALNTNINAPSALDTGLDEYRLTYTIPCIEIAGGTCPGITGPAEYTARIYQFSLMIVGLIALFGLTYGALKYVLSAGKIADQGDAREQMLAAVYGLLILLGAFLILRTINPDLVSLNNPSLLSVPVQQTRNAPPVSPGIPNPVPAAPAPSPTPAPSPSPTPTPSPAPTPSPTPTPPPAPIYPPQSECHLSSAYRTVIIGGTTYLFCDSCYLNNGYGYDSQNGVCLSIASLIDQSDPYQDACNNNMDGSGGGQVRGVLVNNRYKYACESNGCAPGYGNVNGVCE